MNLLPRPFSHAIMVTVTMVWVANFAIQFIPGSNYTPDPLIHGIFMGIVGGALALTRKGGDPPPPPTPPAPTPGPPETSGGGPA